MTSEETLKSYFELVEEDKRSLAYDCIEEYCFFREQIEKLKKLPLIRFDKKNPSRQEITPAGKLIKEYSQALENKRKVLLMILYRVENSAADELLQKLSEFE